ncbi:MAG: methyltransferase [Solirubrobacteraceae bacterium]|nr:methyltransferase [Solirubrobacteraceae bacterium]
MPTDVRLIQHKREAFWFYRFLSPLYDSWVNPLFWTLDMRNAALKLARLDRRDLLTVDVGAGTGFATEGIVAHVDARHVTLLDQSPHQLSRARKKPALQECRIVQGDAEALPFDTDSFDRYVSCGSIEYWPDPAAAFAEAYRVLKPGGIALMVGPLPPERPIAKKLADLWMLFPPESDYRAWMQVAGFTDITATFHAPEWTRQQYGIAIAGRKPAAGASPAAVKPRESVTERMTPARWARWVAGSAAGAVFVPVGAIASLRARRRAR